MLIDFAQTAGNRLLDLDPETRARLGQLEGTVLAVVFSGIDKRLYATIGEQAIELSETCDGDADIVLEGTPLAFVRFMLDRESTAPGGIQIEGDATLAQQFIRILKQLDIDWEEWLSHYLGDVLARQIGRAAGAMRDWARDAAADMRADVTEYLQEESRLLAPAVRVARFLSEVDELRADVERLEQRVKRLAARGR